MWMGKRITSKKQQVKANMFKKMYKIQLDAIQQVKRNK